MQNKQFEVPILMVMFNRPALALKVFERVKEVKPRYLFLAVDGPRESRYKEQNLVEECQKLKDKIDWPCDVKTLFREKNLGCKKAVSSAISWFFTNVDAGIILEDDCLPDLSFFQYCEIMLSHYFDVEQVMHICGRNMYGDKKWGNNSFFFTNMSHIWGWATWKRAWSKYDVHMTDYPKLVKSDLVERKVMNVSATKFFKTEFSKVYTDKIDTWDYQWLYSVWKNEGLCITPNNNLISNIGFGEDATHTKIISEEFNVPCTSFDFYNMNLDQPLIVNKEAVKYTYENFFQYVPWIENQKNRFFQLKKKILKMISRC